MNSGFQKKYLIGALVLLVAGCGRTDRDGSREQILDQGRAISGQFMASLKGRLVAALADGGPTEAIEVCHRDATAITDQALAAAPEVLALRRVSTRWRNPANQADALDLAAWRVFEEDTLESPNEPEDLLVPDPDRGDRLVYYRALRMAPLCLTCHGPPEQIPAGVRTLLAERYPDDRATGFLEGDLRGLIRIDFDSDAGVPPGGGS